MTPGERNYTGRASSFLTGGSPDLRAESGRLVADMSGAKLLSRPECLFEFVIVFTGRILRLP